MSTLLALNAKTVAPMKVSPTFQCHLMANLLLGMVATCSDVLLQHEIAIGRHLVPNHAAPHI